MVVDAQGGFVDFNGDDLAGVTQSDLNTLAGRVQLLGRLLPAVQGPAAGDTRIPLLPFTPCSS